jgi:hypothetical protein
VWEWARDTTVMGSELTRHNLSIIIVDAALHEVSRMNYFDCFPKKYEYFTGFAQALQSKERVILQCNRREPG